MFSLVEMSGWYLNVQGTQTVNEQTEGLWMLNTDCKHNNCMRLKNATTHKPNKTHAHTLAFGATQNHQDKLDTSLYHPKTNQHTAHRSIQLWHRMNYSKQTSILHKLTSGLETTSSCCAAKVLVLLLNSWGSSGGQMPHSPEIREKLYHETVS